jgi:hypothetical protein
LNFLWKKIYMLFQTILLMSLLSQVLKRNILTVFLVRASKLVENVRCILCFDCFLYTNNTLLLTTVPGSLNLLTNLFIAVRLGASLYSNLTLNNLSCLQNLLKLGTAF